MNTNREGASAVERRVSVPSLDNILGHQFDVLDHGFVRVVDYMGSDEAVVQAARVSYGKGTKTLSDDTALIRYLLRNWHTTPFEMCEIKLHVKLPIFVARQWIRHRTASVNEYSGRYSIIDNQFYVPNAEDIGLQSQANKQGRQQGLSDEEARLANEIFHHGGERAYADYERLLGDGSETTGVARELARIGLGVNYYTQWYWKTDLHNLMNFLKLRADKHAQFEIRQYANIILDIMKIWCPITHEAFLDYRLNSASFSAQALQVIRSAISGQNLTFEESGLSRREWNELQIFLNAN